MSGLLQDWSGRQVATAAAAAATAGAVAYAAAYSGRGGASDGGVRWRKVGKVDRLTMFPLKGGAVTRCVFLVVLVINMISY